MAWSESRTGRLLAGVYERVGAAIRGSATARVSGHAASRLSRLTRGSACYRWVTTDAEPTVVVVDLRETRTVGPLVSSLETAVGRSMRAWETSRVHSVVQTVGSWLRNSRSGSLVTALLKPPEQSADGSDLSESRGP